MRRRDYDPGDCDVVVVLKDVPVSRAVGALRPVGRFRSTPYPGVLIGRFAGEHDGGGEPGADRDTQAALIRAAETWPRAFTDVERATPLDVVVPFERDDVTEALCEALSDRAAPVLGRSFHVRAKLRGLKGRVESHAVERALGGYLAEIAEHAGRPAGVTFDDPDVILMIQVLGCRVGFSFLERRVRELAFVRPR